MCTTLEPRVTAPKKPGVGTAVGRPISRVDGPAKVQGEARFAAEVPLEGLTYAKIVSSTIARGRIATLDTSDAKRAPDVVHVITHENAPKLAPPALMMTQPRAAGASALPIMQDADIHWNGEPIAVVVAETQEQADFAASLLRATYDLEPTALVFDELKSHPRALESVLGEPPVVEVGDAEAALRVAAVVIDRTYQPPRHNYCAIELHAATVIWEGDALTAHDTTQMLGNSQWTIAAIFGIDEANVRILSPFVGGGFGGKGLWSHQILAIAAARESGRLSGESVFRVTGGRTTTEQRVALGANADGTLEALIHTGHTAMTPYNNCPEQFSFPARHLYAAKTLHVA